MFMWQHKIYWGALNTLRICGDGKAPAFKFSFCSYLHYLVDVFIPDSLVPV